ncbi:L-serine ammonia-lyase [Auriscalpium vulgare]|uniref:L-serine ammonia-lyase n=1 Tax=Auriscalpium vulgare TaxID=40419 RepID=A0ACB8RJZ8_9AGAM|nr:L-serine ammonia-lyase [Auriscalpium vulgare]
MLLHALRLHRLVARPATRNARHFSTTPVNKISLHSLTVNPKSESEGLSKPEHAVISTFDLFSIGVGPSSSHTVGPMRAGKIFINDLLELDMLEKVRTIKITLHHTPQAILLGLEGSDPETIDTGTIEPRYAAILETKILLLGGRHRITYNMDHDMLWRWDQVLKTHPNGMRFSCFDSDGNLLATNEYFRYSIHYLSRTALRGLLSVGGGFVVNDKTKVDENLFYKGVDKRVVHGARLHQHTSGVPLLPPVDGEDAPPLDDDLPPYPFKSGDSLLNLTRTHNMTIAQIVYDNEKSFGLADDEIHDKLMRIWSVMDECIRNGVHTTETTLPGRLRLRRRAPMLYRRLMRGFYPGLAMPRSVPAIESGDSRAHGVIDAPFDDAPPDTPDGGRAGGSHGSASGALFKQRQARATRVVGKFDHAMLPEPPRKTMIPAMDFLSAYAIAVNEVNASGGRIVTSPTNGAAGVIPAVLKYIIEFVSDDPEKSVKTFLLTAAAIGMLFKRGSTISAAEGGCQAEVGVACSMASAGFAACMGASPETVLQAAEIGIEHNLGLTCDPIDGLVQVPCIERNSLGAVKAVTAAQLSMAADGVYSVTLDEAIEAMRLTAADMSVKYKETSLSGLATTVKIPLTVPAC